MMLPSPPSFRLDGKRALVTGASSGIGLSAAVALAHAGANVTLASRSQEKLEEVRTTFSARGWVSSVFPLDVVDIETTQSLLSRIEPFDILVNSAGMARHAPATDTSVTDFDAVVAINFRGAYFITQAVARGLIAAGKHGSLINVSSQMAHVGGPDRAVYCATKFAVEGFTKAMAIEWGPRGIRVNTICPTFIRTPLTQATFANPERRAWVEQKIKLGRVGELEDVMGAIVYLASDAASLVTGTSILVDGGWTAD